MAHLNRAKRYPSGAGRRDGEVAIAFTLDRLACGRPGRRRRASAFDEAALAMMKRADPVPPPPPAVPTRLFQLP